MPITWKASVLLQEMHGVWGLWGLHMVTLYKCFHIVRLMTTYNGFISFKQWLYIHLCNHELLLQPHKACKTKNHCCISLSTPNVFHESLHVWWNVVELLLVSFMFGVADAAAAASDDDDDDAIAFRPLVYHSPVFHCIDASSREGWHRTMSCAAPAK